MGSRSGFHREAYWYNLSVIAGQPETFFDAEDVEESVVAPATGETVYFGRGPMVEGNLTLASADGVTTYTLGVYYIEAVSPEGKGGFENLSIPEGTALTAMYFVDASASTETTSPGGGTGGTGVTDHGALTGLSDDDHTIYALADGSRGGFSALDHTHLLPPPSVLGTSGPLIRENVSSIAPPAITNEAGDTLLIHLMHRSELTQGPVGWTKLFTLIHASTSGVEQRHSMFLRTVEAANEALPTIQFQASNVRALAAAIRLSPASLIGYTESIPPSAASDVDIPGKAHAEANLPLWFADSITFPSSGWNWTIIGADAYQKLYGDALNGRLAAFTSLDKGAAWGATTVNNGSSNSTGYSGAIVLFGSPDATNPAPKDKPLRLLLADPATPQNGEQWIRQDLTPPEIRTRAGGVTYRLPFGAA